MGSADSAPAPSGASPQLGSGVVLLLDDEPLLLRTLERMLRPDGHELVLAHSPAEAEPVLERPDLDLVLVDLFLGEASGLEVLERVKRERPEVEVVVMTGHASVDSAVGCMRRGAFDYLQKPFGEPHRVRTTVQKAIERRQLMRRNRELERELQDRDAAPELVGRAPAMRSLVRTIHSLRHNESHVLVLGESGTGKELVARAIHAASPRRRGPFVPVDCGALPESVIESELFGHERGAFTGAVGAPGLFRLAKGGTVFLDEIGEIPLSIQAKLLRALQHKEVRPLGGAVPVPVDIRVISATHRDLTTMVDQQRFRADLFYRLDVVRLQVPPLRERPEDIPLLVQHFLAKHRAPGSPVAGIEDEALDELLRQEWPGNVRELENVIESALALATGPRLGLADLRRARGPRQLAPPPPSQGLPLSLEAYERCALERALAESGGDVRQAARRLGIGRSTFYRKLAHHRLRSQPRSPLGRQESIR